MKKSILLLFCSAITINGFSQSDVTGPITGHQRQPGRFCGWAPGLGSVAGPLEIRNNFSDRINFFTANVQRMTMLDGGSTVNDGNIAIGNNLPAGFIPQSRFHVHHTGGMINTSMRFTNTITGSSATNGLEIGITSTGDAIFTNYQINRSFFWNNGVASNC